MKSPSCSHFRISSEEPLQQCWQMSGHSASCTMLAPLKPECVETALKKGHRLSSWPRGTHGVLETADECRRVDNKWTTSQEGLGWRAFQRTCQTCGRLEQRNHRNPSQVLISVCNLPVFAKIRQMSYVCTICIHLFLFAFLKDKFKVKNVLCQVAYVAQFQGSLT